MQENIWFTSDHHFDHDNIIKYMGRPYVDAEEMGEDLIYKWNAVVNEQDRVYHLGDFCFRRDPSEYLKRLNGRIFLVHGNHDNKKKVDKARDDGLLEWCGDVKYLKVGKKRFWLSHYAHRTWPNSHRGSYHLYGHSHGDIPDYGRSMDVGVDAWEYYPVHLESVVSKLKAKDFTYHHVDRL